MARASTWRSSRLPLFITNAFDGDPLPVYGDGRQRREWLHAGSTTAPRSSSSLPTQGPGRKRGLQRRRPGVPRTWTSSGGFPRPDRRLYLISSQARQRCSPGSTIAATPSTPRRRWRSAGSRRTRSDRAAPRGDRRVVPRAPPLVGADQVEASSGDSLRRPVRRALPLNGATRKGQDASAGPRALVLRVAAMVGNGGHSRARRDHCGALRARRQVALGRPALLGAPSSSARCHPRRAPLLDATSTDSSVISRAHRARLRPRDRDGAVGASTATPSTAGVRRGSSPTTTRRDHRAGRDEGRARAARRTTRQR